MMWVCEDSEDVCENLCAGINISKRSGFCSGSCEVHSEYKNPLKSLKCPWCQSRTSSIYSGQYRHHGARRLNIQRAKHWKKKAKKKRRNRKLLLLLLSALYLPFLSSFLTDHSLPLSLLCSLSQVPCSCSWFMGFVFNFHLFFWVCLFFYFRPFLGLWRVSCKK